MTKKTATTDNKKILLTKSGYDKLVAELEDLKNVGRKEVAARLKEAISYGDLSENAEYDEAKNQQAFLEARIEELEEQIKNAEVVADKKTGEIQIGSTVELLRTGDKESVQYQIVGVTEADILSHKISNESPVGAAIIGKKTKDTVTVKTPGGEEEYKIVSVK